MGEKEETEVVVPALIRTAVPVVVGYLLAIPAVMALGLPPGVVASAVEALFVLVYYLVSRYIETKYPKVGRFLLSFWLTDKQPVYQRK